MSCFYAEKPTFSTDSYSDLKSIYLNFRHSFWALVWILVDVLCRKPYVTLGVGMTKVGMHRRTGGGDVLLESTLKK